VNGATAPTEMEMFMTETEMLRLVQGDRIRLADHCCAATVITVKAGTIIARVDGQTRNLRVWADDIVALLPVQPR
jgi:hypothetical protein